MSRYAPKSTKAQRNNWSAAMRGYAIEDKPGAPVMVTQPIKQRKAPVPSNEVPEHAEQVAVIQWWGLACQTYNIPRKCLFAIPNGQILMAHADNPHAVMGYLRSEGLRDGMLDLMLAVKRGTFAGAFLEMKKKTGGTLSEEQAGVMVDLGSQGYRTIRCNGADEAIGFIKHYLAL